MLAGTEIEDCTEGGTRGLFEAEARPALDARPALWGAGEHSRSYRAFVHAAGMVQSRSFHTRAENWLTGKQVEGTPPCLHAGQCSALAAVAQSVDKA